MEDEEHPKKKVGQGVVRIQNVFFDLRSDTMIVLLKGKEVIVKNISDYPFLKGAGLEALQNFNIGYNGIYFEYFAELLRMKDLLGTDEEESTESAAPIDRKKSPRERVERKKTLDRHTKPDFATEGLS